MNKKIKYLLAFISLLGPLLIGGVYILLKRTIPFGSGALEMSILKEAVTVTRDNEGIPHIKAKNKHDLYRAFGYVMASERLFQMEILRRVGSGTLSEIIGEKGLKIDKTFRTIGVRRFFKEKLDSGMLDKEMLSQLDSFYEGVNFFVENGVLPIEFTLAGIKPKKFSTLDAYAVIGYMSYSFAAFMRHDLLNDKLKNLLPENLWKEIQIEPSANSVMTAKVEGGLKEIYSTFTELNASFGGFEGSNAWALKSKRTTSGKSLLASDPHIGFSLPGIWFEAHLKVDNELEPFDIYGHFLPNIPFAGLAHDHFKAFGLTISYMDDMDFYKEKISPTGNEYEYKGQLKSIKRYSEVIKIKDKDDFYLPVRMTEHGPLLDEIIEPKGIALKWTLHHPLNQPLLAFKKMGDAKTFKDFKSAVSYAGSPGLNVVYADAKDNIARLNFGLYPIRAANSDAMSVLDGRGSQEYEGYIPFEEMPHEINPSSGIVLSANNRPISANEKFRGLWQPRDRFITLFSALHSKEKWSVKETMQLQTSVLNSETEWIREIFLNDLKLSRLSDLEKKALSELRNWDRRDMPNRIGSSIYHQLVLQVSLNLLDELSAADREKYCGLTSRWYFLQRMLKREDAQWWDFAATDKIEKRVDIVEKSFKETVAYLAKTYGTDLSDWNWGKLHTIEFVHAFGRKKPFDKIFNLGPYPVMGAYNDVNNFREVGCSNGFKVRAGPSTRRIIDFAHIESSYGILPIGNSGHMLSPFYKNQMKRFLTGKYRLQIFSEELLKDHTAGTLELLPESRE
ncbi:hypothetical protein A9Q84_06925 [Halobacteriovorax marinus]|uniref:Penicillin acylase family protein n=1 Tax=Halobacteriovorax marinus TaxID=97084 RepID=A0A1Y5FFD7_9BACT|nr:hypothetical protein A9Q84_06925 [Halobacteriovorax marinus]